MVGIVITFLLAAYYLLTGTDQVTTFQTCTNFLLIWHGVFAILTFLFVGLLFLGTMGVSLLAGFQNSWISSLLRTAAISSTGVLSFAMMLIRQAALVGGVYLATQALTIVNGQPAWDTTKLVVAGVLYLLGFIMGRSSSR